MPYHIDLKPGNVGEYVLLPSDPARVKILAKFVDNPQRIAYQQEYQTFTGDCKRIRVSCISTCIGYPSTAIAVEELANIGATTFIRASGAAPVWPMRPLQK